MTSGFTQTQYQTLFDYHWLTARRLMDAAWKLSDADYFEQPGFGHGSIHDLLVHTLAAVHNWSNAVPGVSPRPRLARQDFPNLAAVRAGVETEQAVWQAVLDGLDAAKIESSFQVMYNGREDTLTMWRILQHLVLHGMQHHAELAHLLTSKGQSPGDLDFIFFKGV